MERVRLEIQYIKDCPLKDELIKRTEEAIKDLEFEVELEKILIESEEDAERYFFRGSPTLLINGADLEGIPPPKVSFLGCRLYLRGLPSSEAIVRRIREVIRR